MSRITISLVLVIIGMILSSGFLICYQPDQEYWRQSIESLDPLCLYLGESVDTDGDGWSDEVEAHYGTDVNNVTDYPDDSDGDNWTDADEQQYGTDSENATDYPSDLDKDWIPNTEDDDDDGDGIEDTVESGLGLNPLDADDVESLTCKGTAFFLIDKNQDGNFDYTYIHPSRLIPVSMQSPGIYRIDVNGDATWDCIYNDATEIISNYQGDEQEGEGFPWLIIIIIIAIIAAVIGGVVYVLYWYGFIGIEEEVIYEDQQYDEYPPDQFS